MIATFCSLEWKQSNNVFIEQKPNQRKPSGVSKLVKRKPDGTLVYLVPKKNTYILSVQAEGGNIYTEDVYGIIKYYNSKARITKNFRSKFEDYMKVQSYSIDKFGCIEGLYRTIETFLSI